VFGIGRRIGERLVDNIQHKAALRQYFDGIGFARWSAIYDSTERLSPVRRSIRTGHSEMMALAERWLDATTRPWTDRQALDAGCGTGLFSMALARRGMQVRSVDIAPQMVEATRRNATSAGLAHRIEASAGDLETIDGSFDLVCCFDVLIHYPSAAFVDMLAHLAGRTRDTLLFTYAPYSPTLALMHRIGGYFPRGQRRTEIQMVPDDQVRATLRSLGLVLRRSARVSCGFYHVALIEASRSRPPA
jgi:magnesium-protoporphyrin O-methyltransferase